MSRSGYTDDCENLNLYRANVDRSIKGHRGQSLLRDMVEALDAMPLKELEAGVFVEPGGLCCALGSVAIARGIDVSSIDESEPEDVACAMGVAPCLAAEVAYMNDEWFRSETKAERWTRMRHWAESRIKRQPGEQSP